MRSEKLSAYSRSFLLWDGYGLLPSVCGIHRPLLPDSVAAVVEAATTFNAVEAAADETAAAVEAAAVETAAAVESAADETAAAFESAALETAAAVEAAAVETATAVEAAPPSAAAAETAAPVGAPDEAPAAAAAGPASPTLLHQPLCVAPVETVMDLIRSSKDRLVTEPKSKQMPSTTNMPDWAPYWSSHSNL